MTAGVGAVLGVAVGALFVAPGTTSRAPVDSARTDAALLREIRAELGAIRDLLAGERKSFDLAPVDPSPVPRVPLGDGSSAELVAALRALEARLGEDGGGVTLPAAELASTHAPIREDDPPGFEPPTVSEVRASMPVDLAQTDAGFFGLTPAQVYRRFGAPSWVGNSANRTRWHYDDPSSPGQLVFTFVDGYVIFVLSTAGG